MKNIQRCTLIKIPLLVVLGSALIYWGVHRYSYAVSELNQQATQSFQDALKLELAAKDVDADSFTIQREINASAIGKTPQSVFIHTSTGKKEYILSPEKHQRNIVENVEARILHTIALEKHPIIADRLNAIWQQNLQNSQLVGQTALYITVIGQNEQSTSQKTSDYNQVAFNRVPLFTSNLGYLCEVEITGFIEYSWWFVFYQYLVVYLLIVSAICVLFYLLAVYLLKMRITISTPKDISVPQIQIDEPKEVVYKLTDRLVFDAKQGLLVLDQQMRTQLLPQLCTFLELLLKAESYKLSDEVIIKELWPDSSSTSGRLQKVVSRLRQELRLDPSIELKRVCPSSYQLIL